MSQCVSLCLQYVKSIKLINIGASIPPLRVGCFFFFTRQNKKSLSAQKFLESLSVTFYGTVVHRAIQQGPSSLHAPLTEKNKKLDRNKMDAKSSLLFQGR
ncbi:hypothetical protein GOODEAATRI_024975 [Goodea atripinnis]|uniref:Uncharacterized protein n=1 Tax=Goodea atripinnis TaxID=208336 RepID=A0ABV0NGM9_9TELE